MRKPLSNNASSRFGRIVSAILAAGTLAFAPAGAQEIESFDPDAAYDEPAQPASGGGTAWAIDADLDDPTLRTAPEMDETAPGSAPQEVVQDGYAGETGPYADAEAADVGEAVPEWTDPASGEQVAAAEAEAATYGEDDLIGAAEGVFGKGAEGLAGLIEDLLREQGEPNGYIVGREAGGAFIFGARYGSGTLHHRVEGERRVYWTGPSLGFDAGANAANTFVLVYNLYDTEDIFRRYPAGEGQAYFVGGLHASYMRRGDVVLIPIRMGAGFRLGVNAGYMRFSKKQRWLPF